jgi:hypothetical protein
MPLTHLLPPQVAPSPRLLTPTTQPVPLLASTVAYLYTNMHTALVLGWLVLRFRALVADPLSVMGWDVLVLGVCQGAWCVGCLPAAGTWGGSGAGAGTGAGAGVGPGPVVGTPVGQGKGASSRRRAGGVGIGVSSRGGVMVSCLWD